MTGGSSFQSGNKDYINKIEKLSRIIEVCQNQDPTWLLKSEGKREIG